MGSLPAAAVGFVLGLAVAAVLATVAIRRIRRLERRAKTSERLAELGTLTGGLAHEIKNPLSTIQLNLQLALEDLAPEDATHRRLRNRLELCERETGRLREILDDFLRYAGRIELERRPVSLNRMCEEMADFFHPQAQLQRVQLRLRKAEPDVVVSADERQLKQAVLNLMLNAVQAMPLGGDLILSVSATPREAILHVTDTGSGMTPEVQAHVFDAYYSRRRGGTGLGLAMARRIVEEHGGTIGLVSEPGKGTDFAITLPRG
jgi:two-component system sensor histidine kinase HydH